jgi:hypothetical protein
MSPRNPTHSWLPPHVAQPSQFSSATWRGVNPANPTPLTLPGFLPDSETRRPGVKSHALSLA